MPQGPQMYRKKCVTFLSGGGGSPEERPHDISRRQNRYVTLPLANRLIQRVPKKAGVILNLNVISINPRARRACFTQFYQQ